MSEYTPTTEQIRAWFCDPTPWANPDRAGIDFDAWLAAHDAEVRAEYESDPAKDERLVRYMAMATPLGYQSALTVVQQMTALIDAETRARAAGVVAEEPEWEYGYELIESDTRDVLVRSGAYEDEKSARNWASRRQEDEDNPDLPPLEILIVRRRKAGPWVPVKQEGASPSGLPVAGLLHAGGDSHAEREDADQPQADAEPVPEGLIHPPGDDEHEQEQGADEQVPVELHTDDSTPDGRHTGMKQDGANDD